MKKPNREEFEDSNDYVDAKLEYWKYCNEISNRKATFLLVSALGIAILFLCCLAYFNQ